MASQSAVWVMAAVEIAEQVRQLSEKKEYALALQLVVCGGLWWSVVVCGSLW